MFKKKVFTLFLILALFLCFTRAKAQTTYVWQGGTSSTWNTPGNWNVGGVTQILNYPGSNILVTNDIASIPTSNAAVTTITYTGTHTIGQIVTTGYSTNSIAIVLSGAAASLTVSSGLSIIQQNGIMVGLAFSGAGSASIGGTSTFGYQQSMSIAAATTVSFTSGSTLDFTSNQGTLTNNGTLNFTTSTFKLSSFSAFVSPGTVIANNTAFNITGTPAYITYGGKFVSNSCTFTIPSGGYLKSTSASSAFTATTSTFNMSGSGGAAYIYNNGTYRDHASTYNLSGQGVYISNVASSTMHFSGTTVNFSTAIGNNSQNINNAGTFTADSASAINASTFLSNVTNSGTFYAGTSGSACTITLNGQGANVSNTGTFYLGSTSIIYPTAISTSITNTSPGIFTLQSDANGSAAIGQLNATVGSLSSVNGTYDVQRYYQGSVTYDNVKKRWLERNYRIISSPVYNSVQVNSNNVFGLNYIVGATAGLTTTANSTTNTFITGCAGGSTTAGNPSIYLYRESYTPDNATFTDGNFLGITDITNSSGSGTIKCSDGSTYSLPVGTGVFFFDRGAATNWSTRTSAPYIAPENVTLTTTGLMNTFSISAKDWYTPTTTTLAYTGSGAGGNHAVRGFNMIGNPYPCAIDWCTAYSSTGITRSTSIGPTIWVFNPQTNQYDTFIATSSSGGIATGNASRYIMSGQGFFVQATGTSPAPTLTFTESAKAPTQQETGSNLYMGTPVPQLAGNQTMRLKLMIDSLNYDDIAFVFNSSASTKYDNTEDALYIRSNGAPEGLSSFSDDSVKLAINSLPLPGAAQRVIRLNVDATYTGTYTFQKTQLDAIPKLYDIWLMDDLKKDSLDIRNNSAYVFDVNASDTTTYGSNRFRLVIRQNPALMVHLLNFQATKATGGSQVVWTTENEENYTNFTLERSTDGGATFSALDGVLASSQGTYSFIDRNPAQGANAYRLKILDLNGTISYSNVVILMYSNTPGVVASNIRIYPNPATSMVNLAIDQQSRGPVAGQSALQTDALNPGSTLTTTNATSNGNSAYDIKIVNMKGSVVKTASTTQPSWQQGVSDLSPGTYVINVVNKSNNTIVGSGTFIKL
jgi:hypothetical protein